MQAALLSLLAMAGCVSQPGAAAPVDPPRTVEALHGDVAEQADRVLSAAAAQGFSGAAMIEIDGELVFAGGYGWADREARRPFTIDTVAQIGSITKPFTAAALADLVRRGLVDLDQQGVICPALRSLARRRRCANCSATDPACVSIVATISIDVQRRN